MPSAGINIITFGVAAQHRSLTLHLIPAGGTQGQPFSASVLSCNGPKKLASDTVCYGSWAPQDTSITNIWVCLNLFPACIKFKLFLTPPSHHFLLVMKMWRGLNAQQTWRFHWWVSTPKNVNPTLLYDATQCVGWTLLMALMAKPLLQ